MANDGSMSWRVSIVFVWHLGSQNRFCATESLGKDGASVGCYGFTFVIMCLKQPMEACKGDFKRICMQWRLSSILAIHEEWKEWNSQDYILDTNKVMCYDMHIQHKFLSCVSISFYVYTKSE